MSTNFKSNTWRETKEEAFVHVGDSDLWRASRNKYDDLATTSFGATTEVDDDDDKENEQPSDCRATTIAI